MNFISSEQLIARVLKQLSSYQDAGLLDEGDFYRWIKEILVILNIPSYNEVHKIIELEGNRMPIPEDAYRIYALWRYELANDTYKSRLHFQNQARVRVHTKECIDPCGNPCEIEEEPLIMHVKYFVEDKPYTKTYHNKQLLSLKNYRKDFCSKDSPSIGNGSPLEVTMDKKYFYFNFEGGSIYLQYYTFLLDEDGLPLIPDEVKIERAIEEYIVFRFFQEAYYNNYFDALQRMQYAELKYQESIRTALNFVRLPSTQELMEIARKLKARFNRFEI